MEGYISKLETLGLLDGPGVRTVVFLAGCPLRCLYCHNPETWTPSGQPMQADALVRRLLRNRSYYGDTGGVTFSGGEPLVQREFLLRALTLLKAQGIHTCLDTAGGVPGDFSDILRQTDLVICDVKHHDPKDYKALTGGALSVTQGFLEQVQAMNVPLWIRHVVVPGLTDGELHLTQLQAYVNTLRNVQRVELLPYHKMGAHKYQELGLTDPLTDTAEMDADLCRRLQEAFFPA